MVGGESAEGVMGKRGELMGNAKAGARLGHLCFRARVLLAVARKLPSAR